MPTFPGLAHVAVTVSDLARSTAWYSTLFGADPVLDEDEGAGTYHHTVWVVGDGQLFGIHTHVSPQEGAFSPARVGLDPLAIESHDEVAAYESEPRPRTSWLDVFDECADRNPLGPGATLDARGTGADPGAPDLPPCDC